MHSLRLILTSLCLSILPALTRSQYLPGQSVPGPAPIIAHYSFDTDYNSQFNSYYAFPPPNVTGPPLVADQSSVPCPFGQCASFDLVQYLDINPDLPMLGTYDGEPVKSWAVSFWVKQEADPNGGYSGVLGQWGQGSYVWSLRLFHYAPQLLWVFKGAGGGGSEVVWQASQSVSQTGWTHVVLNFNATANTFQYWMNGRLTDTFDSYAVSVYMGLDPPLGWKIGMIDDVMYGLVGALDELWIFGDALTANDILLLHAINSIGSCAPGSAGVGQYGVGSCQTCPTGTYTASIGAIVCTTCPAGTSSLPGSAACQACSVGYNSSAPGGQCDICPAGYYAPAPGTVNCLPCPAGSYSAEGASTCTYCPANTLAPPTSTDVSQCTACPAGSTGGGVVPVCCANGVSPAGQLLASTGLALSSFGVTNQCLLSTDVAQGGPGEVVEFLSEFCGDGYDTVFTDSLQSVYSVFSEFQSTAGTASLQQIYCN